MPDCTAGGNRDVQTLALEDKTNFIQSLNYSGARLCQAHTYMKVCMISSATARRFASTAISKPIKMVGALAL